MPEYIYVWRAHMVRLQVRTRPLGWKSHCQDIQYESSARVANDGGPGSVPGRRQLAHQATVYQIRGATAANKCVQAGWLLLMRMLPPVPSVGVLMELPVPRVRGPLPLPSCVLPCDTRAGPGLVHAVRILLHAAPGKQWLRRRQARPGVLRVDAS